MGTNAPQQARGFDYDEAGDGASYQIDMMKCLREVNVDNNTVGWYVVCGAGVLSHRGSTICCPTLPILLCMQPHPHPRPSHDRYQSTVVGSFQTNELIETFVSYHETIRRCVCIVYDTTSSGINAFKAIRLREAFVKAFKEQALTAEKLAKANISFKDVFEEIPIKVHNSPLVRALLAEIEPPSTSAGTATAKDEDLLSLTFTPYLVRGMRMVCCCASFDEGLFLLRVAGGGVEGTDHAHCCHMCKCAILCMGFSVVYRHTHFCTSCYKHCFIYDFPGTQPRVFERLPG